MYRVSVIQEFSTLLYRVAVIQKFSTLLSYAFYSYSVCQNTCASLLSMFCLSAKKDCWWHLLFIPLYNPNDDRFQPIYRKYTRSIITTGDIRARIFKPRNPKADLLNEPGIHSDLLTNFKVFWDHCESWFRPIDFISHLLGCSFWVLGRNRATASGTQLWSSLWDTTVLQHLRPKCAAAAGHNCANTAAGTLLCSRWDATVQPLGRNCDAGSRTQLSYSLWDSTVFPETKSSRPILQSQTAYAICSKNFETRSP